MEKIEEDFCKIYMHKWSLHYSHSKRKDCIQILNYELRASIVWDWLDGCINLSRSSCLSHTYFHCLSLSLSLRPQLPLCDHTEGLQQRGWGDSCVWERHHQTAVGYDSHINLLPAHLKQTSDLFNVDTLQIKSVTLYDCSHSAPPKKKKNDLDWHLSLLSLTWGYYQAECV